LCVTDTYNGKQIIAVVGLNNSYYINRLFTKNRWHTKTQKKTNLNKLNQHACNLFANFLARRAS